MRFFLIFIFSFMLTLPLSAQTTTPTVMASPIIVPIPSPITDGAQITAPTAVEWQDFIKAIGNAKGGGVLVSILLIVQGLMLLLRGYLGQLAGKWRFFAMSTLTVVAVVVGQVYYVGISWPVALLSAPVLAALQVWFHQAYKQFVVKKGETPAQ
jgi:hypothetical protein